MKFHGVTVNTELIGRLKIGGKWYSPGTVVALDRSDVEVLEMRGISKPTTSKAEPANVDAKKPEVIPPNLVPIQTKSEEKETTGHGNDHDQQSPRKRSKLAGAAFPAEGSERS